MLAAVCQEAGSPFVVHSSVVRREPGPRDVVVRIHAAGICQTDLSLSNGSFGQSFPAVLGHEGAGEVIQIGADVRTLGIGDRVVLTWVPPCGRCYHCVRGETYICAERPRSSERRLEGTTDLNVDGRAVQAGMGTATFAQETVVPENALVPIADDIPWQCAALLGCAVPTGFGSAIHAGGVRTGDTVAVFGCGAVGLSAVQGAALAGAGRVVGIDPQQSRRQLAVEFGATEAHGHVAAAECKLGFDVAIDAVGQSATIRTAWDCTRRGGRTVIVGAGRTDDEVTFSAAELFHDEKQLIGCFYGSCDMMREVPRMTALWRAGRLRLAEMVDEVVSLGRINEAVERQISGDATRVVLAP